MKDYLETFLSSSGDVKTSLDVTAKTQEIDVYFRPTSPKIPPELGLLGKLAQTPCLLVLNSVTSTPQCIRQPEAA